jgi:hypothetical protein
MTTTLLFLSRDNPPFSIFIGGLPNGKPSLRLLTHQNFHGGFSQKSTSGLVAALGVCVDFMQQKAWQADIDAL